MVVSGFCDCVSALLKYRSYQQKKISAIAVFGIRYSNFVKLL